MRARPLAALALALLAGCPAPPPAPIHDPGACGAFGVVDAVPIPKTCPLPVAGHGGTVRVFAVGTFLDYRRLDTYAAYCRAFDDLVRTRVVPCLSKTHPNLLVFPEDATLQAAFIGSRGRQSRAATSLDGGFLPFFESYATPIGYYRSTFPGQGANAQLLLALTDTFHRALETFPDIARQYHVYVALSADLATATESTDPSLVHTLGDPDLSEQTSVWVATVPGTQNVGLVFDPSGAEVGRVDKVHLVPTESALLELEGGDLADMRPVDLPFGRTGIVISKDAWMPDVVDRLDALGTSLTLQPEAFDGWATPEYQGDWLPDVMDEAGWTHTQRAGAIRHDVVSCLTGNLLSLSYDCQSHVTEKVRPGDTPRAFIGQDPYPGLLAVAPWVMADPGPPASLANRRAALRTRGEKLLPGSGDPLEDHYGDSVVAADLSLPADGHQPALGDGPPGALGRSRVALPPASPTAHQRFPALAADGDTVLLAFTEGSTAGGVLRVATSIDGGAHFVPAAHFPLLSPGPVRRLPAVAIAGARRAVAFEVEDPTTRRSTVRVAASTDGGRTWTVSTLGGQTTPAWAPAAAVDPATGAFAVAWADLRDQGHPRPWIATSPDGRTWQTRAVAPPDPATTGDRLDTTSISVAAAGGTVAVAWAGFTLGSWDVYLSTRTGAGGFGAAARVDPESAMLTPAAGGAPVEAERLDSQVSVSFGAGGVPAVAWADLTDRRRETRAALAEGGRVIRVDDAPASGGAFHPSVAHLADGTEVAVWQDLRGGSPAIRLATRAAGAAAFGASTGISDAAAGAQVDRPGVAATGAGVVVAWTDWRTGYARVRVVSGAAP